MEPAQLDTEQLTALNIRIDQLIENQAELLRQMARLSGVVTDVDTRQQATAAAAAQAVTQSNAALQTLQAAPAAQAPPVQPPAPAVIATTPHCSVPKPDKFSGDSQRADTAHNWAAAMSTYLDIHNKLDTPEGPKHAGMFLTGSAASWWYGLTASDPQPFASWQEMMTAFQDYFSSTRKGKDAFRRLTSLEQGGSARDYAKRFRNELLQVDAGLLTPESKLFYFVGGLKVDLRTHVETSNPATYDEAVRIAEAADSAHTFSNNGRRGDSGRHDRQDGRSDHRERRPERVWTRENITSREFRHPERSDRPFLARTGGSAPMELGAVSTIPSRKHSDTRRDSSQWWD